MSATSTGETLDTGLIDMARVIAEKFEASAEANLREARVSVMLPAFNRQCSADASWQKPGTVEHQEVTGK